MAHHHDNSFWIKVCPFEGGSDHDIFLAMDIPALLTWHYTDYRYHASFNTLYMASPAEMENVSLTTLVTSLIMSDTCDDESAAAELLDALKQAAIDAAKSEMVVKTDGCLAYAAQVLNPAQP